jgi:tight adherence protein B
MTKHLLAALGGAALIGGILLTVFGLIGSDGPARPPSAGDRALRRILGIDLPAAQVRRRGAFAVAIVAIVVIGWVYTGIPMVGLVGGLAVASVPWLFGAGRAETRALAKIEAVETWTRRLADLVRSGGGLHQAILISTADAPEAIAPEVAQLASELRSDVATLDALRGFANRLADATSDEVIAALMLNARERGPRLADVLDRVSESIAELITMRREVSASRTDARLSGQILSGLTLGALCFLLFNKTYMHPYHTFAGQIILVVCVAAFAGLLMWMRSLNSPKPVPRLLRGPKGDLR